MSYSLKIKLFPSIVPMMKVCGYKVTNINYFMVKCGSELRMKREELRMRGGEVRIMNGWGL